MSAKTEFVVIGQFGEVPPKMATLAPWQMEARTKRTNRK